MHQISKTLAILLIIGHAMADTPLVTDSQLWYKQPAEKWDEALPVGNGRLGDGDQAHHHCSELLRRSTHTNLFDTHPPFQIDGNFGFTAGVCEMLLQSHCRDHEGQVILDLLPALPKSWNEGSVRGLHARGGCNVEMDWKNGELVSTRINSTQATTIVLRHQGSTRTVNLQPGASIRLNGPKLK